jgi:hypothetical protein
LQLVFSILLYGREGGELVPNSIDLVHRRRSSDRREENSRKREAAGSAEVCVRDFLFAGAHAKKI